MFMQSDGSQNDLHKIIFLCRKTVAEKWEDKKVGGMAKKVGQSVVEWGIFYYLCSETVVFT
jgi:hypothetical protein